MKAYKNTCFRFLYLIFLVFVNCLVATGTIKNFSRLKQEMNFYMFVPSRVSVGTSLTPLISTDVL